MLTLADKVNLVITSVVAIDGELVVSFADGSEIVLSAIRRRCTEKDGWRLTMPGKDAGKISPESIH